MTPINVRSIVDDVDAASAFCCRHLDFYEEMHPDAYLDRGPVSVKKSVVLPKVPGNLLATGVCAVCLVVLWPSQSPAQDNYEIQVYASETMAPQTLLVELHSNYTPEGTTTTEFGMLPTQGQEHETVELTDGMNDWSEIGFYIFTAEQSGHGVQCVGDHIRPRVRIPPEWHWPVGVSLSTEFGYARSQYAGSHACSPLGSRRALGRHCGNASPGRVDPGRDARRNMGMGIVVEYANQHGKPKWVEPPETLWDYTLFASDRPAAAQPDEIISLRFDSQFHGQGAFDSRTINGKSFPHTDPITVREGTRYRLQMVNRSTDDHPMHLHRHTFEVTSIDGKPLSGLGKDVVVVPAKAITEVDFTADNPGATLLHCHNQTHMDFGFMTLLRYA